MAMRAAKISRRLGAARAKWDESKHKRDAAGKFADQPGKGDDAPRKPRRQKAANDSSAPRSGSGTQPSFKDVKRLVSSAPGAATSSKFVAGAPKQLKLPGKNIVAKAGGKTTGITGADTIEVVTQSKRFTNGMTIDDYAKKVGGDYAKALRRIAREMKTGQIRIKDAAPAKAVEPRRDPFRDRDRDPFREYDEDFDDLAEIRAMTAKIKAAAKKNKIAQGVKATLAVEAGTATWDDLKLLNFVKREGLLPEIRAAAAIQKSGAAAVLKASGGVPPLPPGWKQVDDFLTPPPGKSWKDVDVSAGTQTQKSAKAAAEILEKNGQPVPKTLEGEIRGTQTFTKNSPDPEDLDGVAFTKWNAPKSNAEWEMVTSQLGLKMLSVPGEPPGLMNTAGKKAAAGVLIVEDDGRVWLVKPTNEFGGYKHTFPKGGIEQGLSRQANAIKEAYEETGLQVRITGYAGDFEGSTSVTRYYFAKRMGGTPKDHGWESEAVVLAPKSELKNLLNIKRDKDIVDAHLTANKYAPHQNPNAVATGSAPAAATAAATPAAATPPGSLSAQVSALHAQVAASQLPVAGPQIASVKQIGPNTTVTTFAPGSINSPWLRATAQAEAAVAAGVAKKSSLDAGQTAQFQMALQKNLKGIKTEQDFLDAEKYWGPGSPVTVKQQIFENKIAKGELLRSTSPKPWEQAVSPAPAVTPAKKMAPSDLSDGDFLLWQAAQVNGSVGIKTPEDLLNAKAHWGSGVLTKQLDYEMSVGKGAQGSVKPWESGGGVVPASVPLQKNTSTIPDVSTFKKVGGQLGSNEGGIYVDDQGVRHYVKFNKTEGQSHSEVLGGEVFNAMGILTPGAKTATLGGKLAIVTKWNDELELLGESGLRQLAQSSAKAQRQLADMYHASILTKNYDVVGLEYDNILRNKVTGDLVEIDTGASFKYRAQGALKSDGYGKDIPEYDSLMSKQYPAGRIFSVAKAANPQAFKDSIQAIAKMDMPSVRKMFQKSGLADHEELFENFAARRLALLKKEGVAEQTSVTATSVDFAKPSASGATGFNVRTVDSVLGPKGSLVQKARDLADDVYLQPVSLSNPYAPGTKEHYKYNSLMNSSGGPGKTVAKWKSSATHTAVEKEASLQKMLDDGHVKPMSTQEKIEYDSRKALHAANISKTEDPAKISSLSDSATISVAQGTGKFNNPYKSGTDENKVFDAVASSWEGNAGTASYASFSKNPIVGMGTAQKNAALQTILEDGYVTVETAAMKKVAQQAAVAAKAAKKAQIAAITKPASSVIPEDPTGRWNSSGGIHDPHADPYYNDAAVHSAATKALSDMSLSEYTKDNPSVKFYTGNGYSSLNAILRKKNGGGVSALTDSQKKHAKNLDALFSKNRRNQVDTVVYRGNSANVELEGVGGEKGKINDIPPPYEYIDGGFGSLSLKPSIAKNGEFAGTDSDGTSTMFRVRIPKGANVVFISRRSSVSSGIRDEAELLTPRGTRFKYITHEYQTKNGYPTKIIDVELVDSDGGPFKDMAGNPY